MSINVPLPDEVVAAIDRASANREAFVAEAVRQLLRARAMEPSAGDLAKIEEHADELNAEAADVLQFQVIR